MAGGGCCDEVVGGRRNGSGRPFESSAANKLKCRLAAKSTSPKQAPNPSKVQKKTLLSQLCCYPLLHVSAH